MVTSTRLKMMMRSSHVRVSLLHSCGRGNRRCRGRGDREGSIRRVLGKAAGLVRGQWPVIDCSAQGSRAAVKVEDRGDHLPVKEETPRKKRQKVGEASEHQSEVQGMMKSTIELIADKNRDRIAHDKATLRLMEQKEAREAQLSREQEIERTKNREREDERTAILAREVTVKEKQLRLQEEAQSRSEIESLLKQLDHPNATVRAFAEAKLKRLEYEESQRLVALRAGGVEQTET